MKILAINTSGMTAQLALQVDDEKYFSELDASMKHSENLLPEIERLLLKAKLKLSQLEYLAVNWPWLIYRAKNFICNSKSSFAHSKKFEGC